MRNARGSGNSYDHGKLYQYSNSDFSQPIHVISNWQESSRTGLLHKMYVLKFPIYLLKLIGTSYKVKIENFISGAVPIPAGLPQGTKSSSSLYNLFVHDIQLCYIPQIADDLAI
ncbi:hypothetical protein Bhyg_03949 [Pseudolycoriella hygida]|uniref:Reverse transcriptase domain-containing protein n=1 Tax=Pseudolycoriella hygida TaxID=35572 RepID=A0A9Q0NEJ5_9DIPT|nr:hypothetical protein Bhyg_03949 [Pseudolycoriella hygida]